MLNRQNSTKQEVINVHLDSSIQNLVSLKYNELSRVLNSFNFDIPKTQKSSMCKDSDNRTSRLHSILDFRIVTEETHVIIIIDMQNSSRTFIKEFQSFSIDLIKQSLWLLFEKINASSSNNKVYLSVFIYGINRVQVQMILQEEIMVPEKWQIIYQAILKILEQQTERIEEITLQYATLITLEKFNYQHSIGHKKVFILSDCQNFGYEDLSHLFYLEVDDNMKRIYMWDRQGQIVSISIICVNEQSPFSSLGNVVDPSVLQSFVDMMGGELITLKSACYKKYQDQNQYELVGLQNPLMTSIKIRMKSIRHQITKQDINSFKIVEKEEFYKSRTQLYYQLKLFFLSHKSYLEFGSYKVTGISQNDLITCRLLEGFRPTCKINIPGSKIILEIVLNQMIKVFYILEDDNVILVMRSKNAYFHQKLVREPNDPRLNKIKLTEYLNNFLHSLQERDARIQAVNQSFLVEGTTFKATDGFVKLLEYGYMRGDNSKRLRYTMSQLNKLYLLRTQRPKTDQEEGKKSIYEYLEDKLGELLKIFSLRLSQNLFVYHETSSGYVEDFCLLKLQWYSHSLLIINLIYPHQQKISQMVEKALDELIQQDLRLRESVVETDLQLLRMIRVQQGSLAIYENPQSKFIERKWCWERKQMKNIDETFEALSCLRSSLGWLLVPSAQKVDNQHTTQRIYILQLRYFSKLEQRIKKIIVMEIIKVINLDNNQNECIEVKLITPYTDDIMEDGSSFQEGIQDLYLKTQEQDETLINQMYSLNIVYKLTLFKKMNESCEKMDDFDLYFLNTIQGIENRKSITHRVMNNQKMQDKLQSETKLFASLGTHGKINYDYLIKQGTLFQSIDLYQDQNFKDYHQDIVTSYFKVIQRFSNHVAFGPTDQLIKTPNFTGYIMFKLIAKRILAMFTLSTSIKLNIYILEIDCKSDQQFIDDPINKFLTEYIVQLTSELKLAFVQKSFFIANAGVQLSHETQQIILNMCSCRFKGIELTELVQQIGSFLVKKNKEKNSFEITSPLINKKSSFTNSGSSSQLQALKLKIWEQQQVLLINTFDAICACYLKKIQSVDLYVGLNQIDDKQYTSKVIYSEIVSPARRRKLPSNCNDSVLFATIHVEEGKNNDTNIPLYTNQLTKSFSDLITDIELRTKKHQVLYITYYYNEVLNQTQPNQRDFWGNKPTHSQSAKGPNSPLYLDDNDIIKCSLWLRNELQLNKHFEQLMLLQILELKRWEPLTQFKKTIDLITSYQHKKIIQRNKDLISNQLFPEFFKIEIEHPNSKFTMFQFIQVESYYILVMNHLNRNQQIFQWFSMEQEYLDWQDQVIPFWLLIKTEKQQYEIITITPQTQGIPEGYMEMLLPLLEEFLEVCFQQVKLQIKIDEAKDLQSLDNIELQLKFNLSQDQSIKGAPEIKEEEKKKAVNEMYKAKRIQKKQLSLTSEPNQPKKQLSSVYHVPLVSTRLIPAYQYYQPDQKLNNLLKNTFFFQTPANRAWTYFALIKNVTYILVFQEVKKIQQFVEENQEFKTSEVKKKKQNNLQRYQSKYHRLISGTEKNPNSIRLVTDQIYTAIQESQEDQIVSNMTYAFFRLETKLNKFDFDYINSTKKVNIYSYPLNSNISNQQSFLGYVEQQLELIFFKHISNQSLTQESNLEESSVYPHSDNSLTEPQNELIYIFNNQKVVDKKNNIRNLEQIFGKCIALIFVSIKSNAYIQSQRDLSFKGRSSTRSLSHLSGFTLSSEIANENSTTEKVVFEIKSRWSSDQKRFQEYFQHIVHTATLEYFIDSYLQCIQKKLQTEQNTKDSIIHDLLQLKLLFNSQKHNSWNIHHLGYPLYSNLNSRLKYFQYAVEKLNQIIKDKLKIEQISDPEGFYTYQDNENFSSQYFNTMNEMKESIERQDQTEDFDFVYLLSDIQQESSDIIDRLKHISDVHTKRRSTQGVTRNILLALHFSRHRINIYSYNFNRDILEDLHKSVSILSQWSLCRQQVEKKIKTEMLGIYNVMILPDIQGIFEKNLKNIIDPTSFIDQMYKINRDAEKNIKKSIAPTANESKPSKVIESVLNNTLPPVNANEYINSFSKAFQVFNQIQFHRFQHQLDQREKVDANMESIQREGINYLLMAQIRGQSIRKQQKNQIK